MTYVDVLAYNTQLWVTMNDYEARWGMKLNQALVNLEMARSVTEATRLVKQGSVSFGGCSKDCGFFDTGKCDCGGWAKATSPVQEVDHAVVIKVSKGFWRIVERDGRQGFDQLRGVGRLIKED